ncbi:hypothetical protein [Salegentibacter salarius]|uniref:Uncharacterized protein n=1 Tax=Salegentibacter salarius TaxID=435906 RepID=A0A2N0TRD6_9FLAO|nr:hypothetical protein [Salegentibacter salarius]OEY71908.1 hypothetical protein BHS39_14925 [Salegentibacter salarius]PKD17256.1 hypothetical protein APR40_14895 [Salegentibacter salarius]SLK06141.1 hypothetical protein SAMN05660445_03079 [Salegentibacter salarius]
MKEDKNSDIQKDIAILEELDTSSKLIKLGLGELQNIDLDNDFYFLPFQLISQGFERFLKSYICLAYYDLHKQYPDFKYLKNLGHDLELLLKEILDKYIKDYERDQYQEDLKFLQSDKDLNEMLSILSEFGKKARYHNFDLITENKQIGINAKTAWTKFEDRIIRKDKNWLEKLNDFDKQHEIYESVSLYIIVIFEKFISSLSRQFNFNCLGAKGTQLTVGSYFNFALLRESNYGTTDYRKITTRHKQKPKKVHKRTLKDEMDRKLNPKYKSKKINKSEYKGDWPFLADEVIIECREKHWCIVTIDGFDYALNATASGRYQLEFPQEAGMAIRGKNISDFINIARNL